MLQRLGMLIAKGWPLVLFVWALLLLCLTVVVVPATPHRDDAPGARLPASAESVRGQDLLAKAFPGVQTQSQVCIVVARENGPLTTQDLAFVDRLAAAFVPPEMPGGRLTLGQMPDAGPIEPSGPVVGVLTHGTPVVGRELVSPPGERGQATLIILQLRDHLSVQAGDLLMIEVGARLHAAGAAADFPRHLQLGVTGPIPIEHDRKLVARKSWANASWIGGSLLVVAVACVCRGIPALVVTAWTTIAAAVLAVWTLLRAIVAWGGNFGWAPPCPLEPANYIAPGMAAVVAASLTLHLLRPYREEMRRTGRSYRTLRRVYGEAAGPMFQGAMIGAAVCLSLLACRLSDLREAAIGLALGIVVAALASLTLAPALLRAWGDSLYLPGHDVGPPATTPNLAVQPRRFWMRLATLTRQKPLGVIGIAMLCLILPAILGWTGPSSHDALGQLPENMPSTRGTRLLETYFTAGEIGPIVVLAYRPGARFLSRDALWQEIEPLATSLREFTYRDSQGRVVHPIDSVRSLTDPLGRLPERRGLLENIRSAMLRRHSRIQRTYVAHGPDYLGQVTRFDLIGQYNPFSRESIRLLDELSEYLARQADDPASTWFGTEFYLLGTTASIRDLRQAAEKDRRRVSLLMPAIVCMLLILSTGRLSASIWCVLSLGVVALAALGATQWLFSLAQGDSFEGMDHHVPLLLLLTVFALGAESTLLMLRTADGSTWRVPPTTALVRTARAMASVISTGLVVGLAMVALAVGPLGMLRQLGIAAAIAALLAALMVRGLSLPAFGVLYDRLRQRARRGRSGLPPTTDPGNSTRRRFEPRS